LIGTSVNIGKDFSVQALIVESKTATKAEKGAAKLEMADISQ
jgi:hypothetical protein